MGLQLEIFVLGQIDNNTYLLWDDESRQAAVIDPSFNPVSVLEAARKYQLKLAYIWLTHGHFDHYIGVDVLNTGYGSTIPLFLHKDDSVMYTGGGLAGGFGIPMQPIPEPAGYFTDNQVLYLGESQIKVLHTPGHSPGHVSFQVSEPAMVFTGDLIFKQSVGRTDLPDADQDKLLKSIYTQILTLPEETIILPGHGEATTVSEEIEFNPYLN